MRKEQFYCRAKCAVIGDRPAIIGSCALALADEKNVQHSGTQDESTANISMQGTCMLDEYDPFAPLQGQLCGAIVEVRYP